MIFLVLPGYQLRLGLNEAEKLLTLLIIINK